MGSRIAYNPAVLTAVTWWTYSECDQWLLKERHMSDTLIHSQYSAGHSRRNIEDALVAAGKSLHKLQPADLALLEDFHTMGRFATSRLVDLAGLGPDTAVLDAGSGIGGTARYIA